VGVLGGTYLSTGKPIEYAIFFLYFVLTALGIFKSPYFLAAAWLFHPLWDFLPRTLPDKLHDLPVACALFDTPIGLYLAWGGWKKRWPPVAEDHSNRKSLVRTARTIFISFLILGASAAIAASAEKDYLKWVGLASATVIILGFRSMGAKAELIAWAILTGWLGMTYAHTGPFIDATFFFVYVAISAYGVFRSPSALAFAWFAFIPWGFLPHHRMHMPPNFPVATLFYCLPMGLYLLWGARKKRWEPMDEGSTKEDITHEERIV
jgi:hypothetical protein